MLKIKRTETFGQNLKNLCREDPSLLEVINERIRWFEINPDDTRLRTHPLRKRLGERWAFSITRDIRIVYRWIGKTTVRFLVIGGHKKIYLSQ